MGKLISFCLVLAAVSSAAAQDHSKWRDYGGAPDSAQYSSLNQINRSNVKQLSVAWSYKTGDGKKYSFNPIVVDGMMYVLAHNNSIVALDAATGKQVWEHSTGPANTLITDRGLNYWESEDRSDRRLLFAVDNLLQAIDARTGKSITSFGSDGRVDLRQGLGRDLKSVALVQSTTPGKVFENLLILGSATNQEYDSAPGDIRAFDVRTGKLAWTFHTIPHPGEFGYNTWPKDAWKTVGGPTPGANYRLTKSAASSMFPLPVRNTISTEPIVLARICSAIVCLRLMPVQGSAYGIFRWFTTISGTTTIRRRQSSLPLNTMARKWMPLRWQAKKDSFGSSTA